MPTIGCYRKADVLVSWSVRFSSPRIKIQSKFEVEAVVCGWSKTGLKKQFFLIVCGLFFCVDKCI